MSINFMSDSYSKSFVKSIRADKVSVDGYEVENLLSQNSKGFIAEYFIKPPVNIFIYFQRAIDISHIVIDPKVGKQRSKDFSISVQTLRQPLNVPTKNLNNPTGSEPTDDTDPATSFDFLAKTLYQTPLASNLPNSSKLSFYNPNYFPIPNSSKNQALHVVKNCGRNVAPRGNLGLRLTNRNTKNVCGVWALKVTILSVVSASSAVVKSLEVYGKPSLRTDSRTRKPSDESLLQVLEKNIRVQKRVDNAAPFENLDNLGDGDKEAGVPSGPPPSPLTKEAEGGEGSLDCITLEDLTDPVLLPSGKVINSHTLFRCMEGQKLAGRLPSDPFTGLTFDRTRYPVRYTSGAKVKNGGASYGPGSTVPAHCAMFHQPRGSTVDRMEPSSRPTQPPLTSDTLKLSNGSVPSSFLCDFCYTGQTVIYEVSPCHHLVCRSCLKRVRANRSEAPCISSCASELRSQMLRRIYDLPVPRPDKS